MIYGEPTLVTLEGEDVELLGEYFTPEEIAYMQKYDPELLGFWATLIRGAAKVGKRVGGRLFKRARRKARKRRRKKRRKRKIRKRLKKMIALRQQERQVLAARAAAKPKGINIAKIAIPAAAAAAGLLLLLGS